MFLSAFIFLIGQFWSVKFYMVAVPWRTSDVFLFFFNTSQSKVAAILTHTNGPKSKSLVLIFKWLLSGLRENQNILSRNALLYILPQIALKSRTKHFLRQHDLSCFIGIKKRKVSLIDVFSFVRYSLSLPNIQSDTRVRCGDMLSLQWWLSFIPRMTLMLNSFQVFLFSRTRTLTVYRRACFNWVLQGSTPNPMKRRVCRIST